MKSKHFWSRLRSKNKGDPYSTTCTLNSSLISLSRQSNREKKIMRWQTKIYFSNKKMNCQNIAYRQSCMMTMHLISQKQDLWLRRLYKMENSFVIITFQRVKTLLIWVVLGKKYHLVKKFWIRVKASKGPERAFMRTKAKSVSNILLWIFLCASSIKMEVSCPRIIGFSTDFVKNFDLSSLFCLTWDSTLKTNLY